MRNALGQSGLVIGLILALMGPGWGADWYASPTGKKSAAGSMAAPWDLGTALKGGPARQVQPGDTIYLRGGTYLGKFTGTVRGSATAPVTIRSYPGEWAKIDGFATTTLAATIDATTQRVTLADATNFPEGTIAIVDNEHLNLYSVGFGAGGFLASRGWNGTPKTSHAAGALVIAGGNNLTVAGRDTIYRDFEITNSDPIRTQAGAKAQNAPRLRGEGVWLSVPGVKLINLVIHDCQEGIFAHTNATGSEVYGCIIYNNGYVAGGAYNGHGVYGQNSTGQKRFDDLIVFNNFSMGVKQESQSANTIGMHHDGLIAFNNHSPAGTTTRRNNILIGANNGKADDCSITNSFFYHPPGTAGTSVRMGYVGGNGKGVVTGSWIVGGRGVLEIDYWTPLTVTGNWIASSGSPQEMVLMRPTVTQVATWDNNAYWNGKSGAGDSFYHGSGSPPLLFPSWQQKTGFDANSTYSPTLPTTNWIAVRPNKYETGRAHIVVYNWTKATSVGVDLGGIGLSPGQRFEIRDVQNYFGAPVLTGTYSHANPTVSVPLTATTVTPPVGHNVTPAHTGLGFFVGVVLPVSGSVIPPPPPPPPLPTVPVITTVTPNPAPAGAMVTISGTLFGIVRGVLQVDGVPAGASSWSDTQIQVMVPTAWSVGPHQLRVVRGDGMTSNTVVLTVSPPAPPPVDPKIAEAEALLQSWLSTYGSYAASNPAFQQKFAGVLSELRKSR